MASCCPSIPRLAYRNERTMEMPSDTTSVSQHARYVPESSLASHLISSPSPAASHSVEYVATRSRFQLPQSTHTRNAHSVQTDIPSHGRARRGKELRCRPSVCAAGTCAGQPLAPFAPRPGDIAMRGCGVCGVHYPTEGSLNECTEWSLLSPYIDTPF